MKKIALTLVAISIAGGVIAQEAQIAYVQDTSTKLIWKNNFGECWRTISWSPERALPECDPSLVKPVAAAVPAPAPAPAAAPAPAPVPAPVAAPAPTPVPVVAVAAVPVVAAAAAPEPKKVSGKITLAASTAFAVGKSELTPEGKAAIDQEVMTKLAKVSKIESISIVGHADPSGKEADNVKLSKNRAEAVKNYMVSKGVKAEVISTEGKGSSVPLPEVKCDPKLSKDKLRACYAPLRRIEVSGKGEQ